MTRIRVVPASLGGKSDPDSYFDLSVDEPPEVLCLFLRDRRRYFRRNPSEVEHDVTTYTECTGYVLAPATE